jgi:hypothetical protein
LQSNLLKKKVSISIIKIRCLWYKIVHDTWDNKREGEHRSKYPLELVDNKHCLLGMWSSGASFGN